MSLRQVEVATLPPLWLERNTSLRAQWVILVLWWANNVHWRGWGGEEKEKGVVITNKVLFSFSPRLVNFRDWTSVILKSSGGQKRVIVSQCVPPETHSFTMNLRGGTIRDWHTNAFSQCIDKRWLHFSSASPRLLMEIITWDLQLLERRWKNVFWHHRCFWFYPLIQIALRGEQ